MRTLIIAASLAAIAVPATLALAQIAPPERKAGYWEQTMIMQSPRAMTMKSQFCTDATVEKKMSALGQATPGQACGQPTIGRVAGGYSFESTCKMGSRTTHTKGTATGDFNSAYKVSMASEMSPPIAGNGQSTMEIDSKYIGPCPAGKKPGDMTMPGGITVNILSMSGKAPG